MSTSVHKLQVSTNANATNVNADATRLDLHLFLWTIVDNWSLWTFEALSLPDALRPLQNSLEIDE